MSRKRTVLSQKNQIDKGIVIIPLSICYAFKEEKPRISARLSYLYYFLITFIRNEGHLSTMFKQYT